MELCNAISTCCDNGHGLCDDCSFTMTRMDPWAMPKCPVCRSPQARNESPPPTAQPPPPPTVRKLYELMSITKVACAFRPQGCRDIVPLSLVPEHESLCPYVTRVRCMVAYCSWLGDYEDTFRHVSSDHQYSAYDVSENRFLMPDLTFGLRGTMRRMYLVRNTRDGGRLYWVGVARPTNASTHVTVLKVYRPGELVEHMPDMLFRVKTINKKGLYQMRGRPRPLCWDRTLFSRSAAALGRGVDRETCLSALNLPPWCIANVFNEQQYDAIIRWNVRFFDDNRIPDTCIGDGNETFAVQLRS